MNAVVDFPPTEHNVVDYCGWRLMEQTRLVPPVMALERFRDAQSSRDGGYESALAQLEAGAKTGHWIWYVFPQLAGLGSSPTSRSYALRDLSEAREYLRDPVLGPRLVRITGVVAAQLTSGARLDRLMGGRVDAMKLVSSLSLFELAARESAREDEAGLAAFVRDCAGVLAAAEQQGFPRCRYTLEHARASGPSRA